MRRQVSLLIEAGHTGAPEYPLGKLTDEVELVVARQNTRLASEMALMQMVISTQPNERIKPSSTRKTISRLNEVLNKLTGA